jgi:hypothetical protein
LGLDLVLTPRRVSTVASLLRQPAVVALLQARSLFMRVHG